MAREFVHLHLHTEYSLLDGACRISELPSYAKEQGHTAAAITDHGSMYGVVKFYKSCKAEGIKPIIGCEVYVAPRSMSGRDRYADSTNNHLILLVKNEIGYKNLIYLVSKAFTEGFYSKPRIDLELLRQHTDGLIALSACLAGFIPRAIMAGNYEEAEKHALMMRDMFGDGNYYLEVQDHGIEDQKTVNEAIRDISSRTGIPMVATNDVHYLRKSDADAQAVLLCIQTNNVITDGRPVGFETDEFYYKSTDEMYETFRDYPGACENTVKIAEMCNFELEFGKTKLPRFTPDNGMQPGEYLRMASLRGLKDKHDGGYISYTEAKDENTYRERLEYELSVIEKMGYNEYFLIVRDFVTYAKTREIPVGPGRGSGAGSLAAYLIGITDVDPIKFDLIFERFLNPERVSMPDFDIDFCDERRDEVIAYVREKYGDDHVVQIITFGTMAARAAVRDVGRALGMPYSEVDSVAREIPQTLGMTLEKAIDGSEKLSKMREHDPRVRRLLNTAASLEGMPRHASTHAAGVVITDRPVTDYVPVSVNGGIVVTQYDMDAVAELGLLKFDFLALRYLTIIDNAEKKIKERVPDFDLSAVDTSDAETYELISFGRTSGVFQLESAGMRRMLTRLKPSSIEDIIAAIALYRPGPMDSIPRYIEGKQDPSRISYKIKALAPILNVTYGCIVYQEQVMQIFREIAGYSYGHADIVRRAISKKKSTVLLSERKSFIDGAVRHGESEETAAELFDEIVSFANYAFNRSHAAAYAVLAFRTAYLKAHYPKEYYSALISSVFGSSDKIAEYSGECAQLGIRILPPDINMSEAGFGIEKDGIRYGLLSIKSIGGPFIDSLTEERRIGGKFTDFDDFLIRMKRRGMNKKQLEMLIKSGSLDSLRVKRSQLLAVYESAIERGADKQDDGQLDMFSGSGVDVPVYKTEFPEIPELTAREKLALEKESSGMYLSGHLMDDYVRSSALSGAVKISDIKAAFGDGEDDTSESSQIKLKDRAVVKISGVVTERKNKTTRKGESLAFVTIEDRTSEIEVICFSSSLTECGYLLVPNAVVCVTGSISLKDEGSVKLILKHAENLIPDASLPAETQTSPASVKKNDGVRADYRLAGYDHHPGVSSSVSSETPKGDRPPLQPRKIFLKIPSVSSPELKRAMGLVGIFDGPVPVVYYAAEENKRMDSPYGCSGSDFLINELVSLLGEENVVVQHGEPQGNERQR